MTSEAPAIFKEKLSEFNAEIKAIEDRSKKKLAWLNLGRNVLGAFACAALLAAAVSMPFAAPLGLAFIAYQLIAPTVLLAVGFATGALVADITGGSVENKAAKDRLAVHLRKLEYMQGSLDTAQMISSALVPKAA